MQPNAHTGTRTTLDDGQIRSTPFTGQRREHPRVRPGARTGARTALDDGQIRTWGVLRSSLFAKSFELGYNGEQFLEADCMRINRIIWYRKFVEKLWDKHRVEVHEAEEALQNRRRARRVKRGHIKGEDVYLALGQTDAGRYLSVFFVYKKSHDAIVISARDMDAGERREYGKA